VPNVIARVLELDELNEKADNVLFARFNVPIVNVHVEVVVNEPPSVNVWPEPLKVIGPVIETPLVVTVPVETKTKLALLVDQVVVADKVNPPDKVRAPVPAIVQVAPVVVKDLAVIAPEKLTVGDPELPSIKTSTVLSGFNVVAEPPDVKAQFEFTVGAHVPEPLTQ
jgi:hypothetical protein